MSNKFRALVASAVLAFGVASGARATTLAYTNTHVTPQMQLILEDETTPGKYRFSLSTTVGTADYLGFGFNYAGTSISQSDISLISATNKNGDPISPTLKLFGDNTGSQSKCGKGCNFNGSGSASAFDYIIRIGANGGGDNYVQSVVFELMLPGSLENNPFSQMAVRAQSTSNPGGSIKADLVPDTPAPVPLPAGLPLLATGLLAVGILRRRRKA